MWQQAGSLLKHNHICGNLQVPRSGNDELFGARPHLLGGTAFHSLLLLLSVLVLVRGWSLMLRLRTVLGRRLRTGVDSQRIRISQHFALLLVVAGSTRNLCEVPQSLSSGSVEKVRPVLPPAPILAPTHL